MTKTAAVAETSEKRCTLREALMEADRYRAQAQGKSAGPGSVRRWSVSVCLTLDRVEVVALVFVPDHAYTNQGTLSVRRSVEAR